MRYPSTSTSLVKLFHLFYFLNFIAFSSFFSLQTHTLVLDQHEKERNCKRWLAGNVRKLELVLCSSFNIFVFSFPLALSTPRNLYSAHCYWSQSPSLRHLFPKARESTRQPPRYRHLLQRATCLFKCSAGGHCSLYHSLSQAALSPLVQDVVSPLSLTCNTHLNHPVSAEF